MNHVRRLQISAWVLSIMTVLFAIIVWGQGIGWQLTEISAYQLFPLFGLLAFSLIWTHYIMAAARRHVGLGRNVLLNYFETTSSLVLAFLLLHPGLLIWQLWRDGFGLPPASYKSYVGDNLAWLTILGAIALVVFLAYELRRLFADRPWWRFVQIANDIAVLAIFYHGIRLGGELQSGWYRFLWMFYGITLIIAIVYSYLYRFRKT